MSSGGYVDLDIEVRDGRIVILVPHDQAVSADDVADLTARLAEMLGTVVERHKPHTHSVRRRDDARERRTT